MRRRRATTRNPAKPQQNIKAKRGSRSIVEAHGGRLWADANVPRGAIFRFTVPAVAASEVVQ